MEQYNVGTLECENCMMSAKNSGNMTNSKARYFLLHGKGPLILSCFCILGFPPYLKLSYAMGRLIYWPPTGMRDTTFKRTIVQATMRSMNLQQLLL